MHTNIRGNGNPRATNASTDYQSTVDDESDSMKLQRLRSTKVNPVIQEFLMICSKSPSKTRRTAILT